MEDKGELFTELPLFTMECELRSVKKNKNNFLDTFRIFKRENGKHFARKAVSTGSAERDPASAFFERAKQLHRTALTFSIYYVKLIE